MTAKIYSPPDAPAHRLRGRAERAPRLADATPTEDFTARNCVVARSRAFSR